MEVISAAFQGKLFQFAARGAGAGLQKQGFGG
jgi:hypothetical protein